MAYKHFSVEERERIQELLWAKESVRTIAKELGRSPSSVSREIQRNIPQERRRYTPRLAHERALENRSQRGREKRLKNAAIRRYVHRKLKARWSPEQIAGGIKADLNRQAISHEAIYQYIYAQIHRSGYGLLKPGKEDLRPYLKRRHKKRIPKGSRTCKRVLKPQAPSIETRPKIVEKRKRVGDWESDTVEGKLHTPGINTLVERKTGLVFITKLTDGKAETTAHAVIARLQELPQKVRRTITFDNGKENFLWEHIQQQIKVRCFFAHPYASYERGTNENTNGLIRWYFPKGTDFRTISDEEIKAVEHALNTRPRKRLGWKSPLEVFTKSSGVALTY